MTMSDIAGAAEFLSGDGEINPAVAGFLAGFLSGRGGLSQRPAGGGLYGGDPVEALLGWGSEIAGAGNEFVNGGDDAALGLSLNPINWFKHKSKQQQLTKGAINSKLAQHGAAVLDRANTKARRYPCPLTPQVVPAGNSATIIAQPQTLYRPERFFIPASIAPSFVVTDIKVGNISQFPTTGSLPGEMFTQNAVDSPIVLDTVNPAIQLVVVVTNISAGSLTFYGGFIGTNVQ